MMKSVWVTVCDRSRIYIFGLCGEIENVGNILFLSWLNVYYLLLHDQSVPSPWFHEGHMEKDGTVFLCLVGVFFFFLTVENHIISG